MERDRDGIIGMPSRAVQAPSRMAGRNGDATRRRWALLGCTVAPGFEFEDFELGKRDALLGEYPAYAEMIRSLTRD